MRLPSLTCDYFKLTKTVGAGTGESLTQFPIAPEDCILADRGCSTAKGVHYAVEAGGQVTVRVNSGSLISAQEDGGLLDLVESMKPLQTPGTIGAVPARTVAGPGVSVPGGSARCAGPRRPSAWPMRESAGRRPPEGRQVQPATLELAQYVILFTTVPERDWADGAVLGWYRTRWQVELVFKRFKSLAQLWAACRSTTTTAPRLGCTASWWQRCWRRRSTSGKRFRQNWQRTLALASLSLLSTLEWNPE